MSLTSSSSAVPARASDQMADPRLIASLDLMRRMPPSRMETFLEGASSTLSTSRMMRYCYSSAPILHTQHAPTNTCDLRSWLTLHRAFGGRAGRPRPGPGGRSAEHRGPAAASLQGHAEEHLPALRLQSRPGLIPVSIPTRTVSISSRGRRARSPTSRPATPPARPPPPPPPSPLQSLAPPPQLRQPCVFSSGHLGLGLTTLLLTTASSRRQICER